MINCIAVDDEPLALKQLENYISQVPFLDFKGGCRCAAEAMKYIREDIVDAIFPDFDSLKNPFFLRSDNQYIVKSADFSG